MGSLKAQHVAVIGAGISGVATAAHLLRNNVKVTVFERNSSSGGVWVYNEKPPPEPEYPSIWPSKGEIYSNEVLAEDLPGPCHPGLKNNVGTRLMKTSLLEWPAGTPDITTHDVMKQYIQEMTHQYGVHEHVRYGTSVLKVEKQGDSWSVKTRARRRDSVLNGGQPAASEEKYDAVIVATGHYHAPRIPDIPGLSTLKQQFPSRISHSKGYRGAETLAGKNVLLIGSGASAIDVARDAAPLTRKLYHSYRNGQFDIPLKAFPEQTIHVGEVLKIDGTGAADQKIENDQPLPAHFQLADGTRLCDVDVIILCTGYHISLPFLAERHDDNMPVDQATEDIIITDGTMYHNLHKDIFYIPDPSLLFIGVPYYTANFSLFDFQAQAVATLLAGHATLPSQKEMREEYNQKLAEKGAGKKFHSYRGTEEEYVHELLGWVNPQLEAKGKEALKGHTPEWLAAKEDQRKHFSLFFNPPGTVEEPTPILRQEVLCS